MELTIWENTYNEINYEGYVLRTAPKKMYDLSSESGIEGFIKSFLVQQNKYPLYISFEVYHWDYQTIIDDLKDIQIKYSFQLVPQNSSYTFDENGKMVYYDLPIFTVEVQNYEEFIKLYDFTFPFASTNFYAISNQNNLSFESCTLKQNWNNKVYQTNCPHFTLDDLTTIFLVTSDALVATMVTNQFATLEQFIGNIPSEIKIRQINDEMVE